MKKLNDVDYAVERIQLRERLHGLLASYRASGMEQRRVAHYPLHLTERRGALLPLEGLQAGVELPDNGGSESV